MHELITKQRTQSISNTCIQYTNEKKNESTQCLMKNQK